METAEVSGMSLITHVYVDLSSAPIRIVSFT
jgi:hypothetical protein